MNTPGAFHDWVRPSNVWKVMVYHVTILAGKVIENKHPMILSAYFTICHEPLSIAINIIKKKRQQKKKRKGKKEEKKLKLKKNNKKKRRPRPRPRVRVLLSHSNFSSWGGKLGLHFRCRPRGRSLGGIFSWKLCPFVVAKCFAEHVNFY